MYKTNFLNKTRFLWIGGIMGVCQQLLGGLHQENSLLDFTQAMGGLEIYAAIILFIIFRDRPPKEQLKDIFLFFVGLDFFYYFYIFISDIFWFYSYNNAYPDNTRETSYFFQNTLTEIYDFISWTALGTAGAFWGFFATRFRNANKNKLYLVMLAPLFLVIIFEFSSNIIYMIFYIIQQYNESHNMPLPPDIRYSSTLVGILTDFCIVAVFVKKYYNKKVLS